jgi:type III pantothenate kinase
VILLIDIGNSRIKWAEYQGGTILAVGDQVYTPGGETFGWVHGIAHKPDAIYVASVGHVEIEHEIAMACEQRWGIRPERLHTTEYCAGVSNGYDEPALLGVDRWAAIIGAYHLTGGACVVIDCGTACTADFIDLSGRHKGGAILPGLVLMQQSLSVGTVRIGEIGSGELAGAPGVTTEECIHLGTAEALAGYIERMGRMATKLLGNEVCTVLTGGDAPLLLPLLTGVRHEKELVFIGMGAMVAEKGE